MKHHLWVSNFAHVHLDTGETSDGVGEPRSSMRAARNAGAATEANGDTQCRAGIW
jgi:hypothetical protein